MSRHAAIAFLAAAFLLIPLWPARADDFLGKPAAEWLKELSDPKPEVRRGAAFALGKCGSAAAATDLLRALGDADGGVREAAAFALGEVAADREAVPWRKVGGAVRKVLAEDKDARARRSAACAIGHFGPDAAEAREDLERALADKDAAVRQNAAWALGRLKEKAGASGVSRLARALHDEDPGVRRDAAGALGEVGRPTATPAVRDLVKCLVGEKAAEVRPVAVGSLVALIGPEDKEVAADLRGLLKEEDREVRRGAALALAKIGGEPAREAVPVLVDALRDDDAAVRELAAAALANVGEPAGEAVPALGRALSDRSPEVRRNAALALTHVGSRAGEVIRPLVRALDAQQPAKVRHYAAEAISRSEDAVNAVVPELLDVVRDDRDTTVRQHVVMALHYVNDFEKSGAARALEKVLDETHRDTRRLVRYSAARVLGHVLEDKAPPKAVDVLVEMLDDTRLLEYKGTDSTLNKGNESVKSGTGAEEKLGSDARYMAARALAEIARGGKRKDALDALRKAAESTDPVKKRVAADALKSIGER
jgi:HEAT repeat protein